MTKCGLWKKIQNKLTLFFIHNSGNFNGDLNYNCAKCKAKTKRVKQSTNYNKNCGTGNKTIHIWHW